MTNETNTEVTLPELVRVLDFAADALALLDLTCQDAPEEGKRCEECGSCAGYAALDWARTILAKARTR